MALLWCLDRDHLWYGFTMAPQQKPLLARLRPSLNQAMVVTMAVIWEEAIDGVGVRSTLGGCLQ